VTEITDRVCADYWCVQVSLWGDKPEMTLQGTASLRGKWLNNKQTKLFFFNVKMQLFFFKE